MSNGQAQHGDAVDDEIELARHGLRPVSVVEVREEITQLICQHAFAMIFSTIAEVRKGRYTALKFLFEIASIYPGQSSEEDEHSHGLARTLLERMGLLEENSSETGYERLEAEQMSGASHAVK
jgi:hypothetical protein